MYPSSWTGSLDLYHQNLKELQVFIGGHGGLGSPMSSWIASLDQMNKVQAPAVLNSIHATHKEALALSSTPLLYSQEELLPGGSFGDDHTSLFFGSTETAGTILTYWLLPFSSSQRWHICQQERPR